MSKTMELSSKRGFKYALLFARRAVDHLYVKHGFYGVAAYNEIEVRIESAGKTNLPIEFRPLDEAYAKFYQKVYDDCYDSCNGFMHRDLYYWKYVLEKLKSSIEVEARAIFFNEKPAGYVIYTNNKILEIAFEEFVPFTELVRALHHQLISRGKNKTLVFEASFNHALHRHIIMMDYKITFRECHFGGHMMKKLTNVINSPNDCRSRQGRMLANRADSSSQICNDLNILTPKDIGNSTIKKPFNVSYLDRF